MQLPLQVSFHNMEPSEAIEHRVRAEAARLDEFCDHVMSCRVVVDVPHRHHRSGDAYQVRIDIKVPGAEIPVVHEPTEGTPDYRDVNIAIRDAFDAAVRQLEDYVRRRRGKVKQHEVAMHGRVSKLFPQKGYGFIDTPDGREVYFHANSVLGGKFDDLTIGTEVAYCEEPGDKGPQASSLRIVGKYQEMT